MKLAWHPFALKFPLLEGDERAAFRESIKKTGGNEEPVIFRTRDGKKEYLDGRNRVRECEALGLAWREEERDVPDDDVYDFIARRNLRRRHLDVEQRRPIVVELRAQGESLRGIAETLGVSEKTVRNDLKYGDNESEEGAENSAPDSKNSRESGKNGHSPERVTGRDGKEYPAEKLCKRCRRVGKTEGCQACAELRSANKGGKKKASESTALDSESNEDVVTDAEGDMVPEQAREAFAQAKVLVGICRDLNGIVAKVEDVAKGPGGRLIGLASVRQHLKDAKGNLWANRATHVCPYCQGKKKDCECCKGSGWTAKHVWQQAPGVKK